MTLSRVRCPDCGAERGVRVAGSGLAWEEGHVCVKRPLAISKGVETPSSGDEGSLERAPHAAGHRMNRAVKTTCGAGHTHPSKTEARVCDRLTAECAGTSRVVVRNVGMPLLVLPRENGTVPRITVDFGIIDRASDPGHALVRLIDAKSRFRPSRDWPARKRACELSWGITIEECER